MIKLLKERVAKGVKVRVLGSVKGNHDGWDESAKKTKAGNEEKDEKASAA